MRRFALVGTLLATLLFAFSEIGRCDTPPEVINLNFPASDAMSVTDCLKVVAMETGEVLLPDASVNGAVGAIHATESSVPDTLSLLKQYEPGLTWRAVYYPAASNEPAGEDLYKAILTLQALNVDGLVIPPTGDDKEMLTFKKQTFATPDQETLVEAGFKKYYLISDPAVRAQMLKNAKTAAASPGVSAAAPIRFNALLSQLSNQISQLTAVQQAAVMSELSGLSKQIQQTVGQPGTPVL